MQVILLQRIGRLGQMGDVVNVKDGYARNFLLPQKKALRANEENKKVFEGRRAQLEAENLSHKKDAETVSAKLDGMSFTLIRAAGDTGQLYGSVSTRDIAEVVSENGFTVNRNQIILDKPIKALGLTEAKVQLHPEVVSAITLNIARSQDEADKQARGENVTVVQDEALELETFNPDAEFEDARPEAESEGDAA
ncbi:50S ribosomal protein L9 [Hyphomicrobium methylovorum]|uniref:50S ribosomal protein L9 n=1 Tax=Hyphomicrobium methylovorum TaxID=84 RepID=UPI0015E6E3E9|nr:50S ribosomal protein L9 [Hyphomicrobium methylovorum]MBA2127745.1 50S ribosomal protein L9 [Hyphomicrobium methylovorum]